MGRTYRDAVRVVAGVAPPCGHGRLVGVLVASDRNALDRVPEVPVGKVVRVLPVDEAARPVDRALRLVRAAAGPD